MKYLILIIAIALSGCATTEYQEYAKAQADVARARADADTARYNALSKIAETGDSQSKIAAVMALAFATGGVSPQQTQQIMAPQASNAFQWASLLIPNITNVAGMALNARVAMSNADNNARISESTNSAFLGIAGKIQAPVIQAATVVTPQANVSTVTTTTNDNHASTSTSNTSTTSSTTSNSTASTANTTSTSLGGSGVIGNGTYTASPTTANPVTTNNNPVTTTNPPGKTCSVSAAGVLVCL